jgi:hypothetical protein
VSIQDLQQNPQDTSNFYLANMYQAAINPNGSSALPVSPPPFTPPNFAIWVNTLWFLSLVISITCALLATLLQQWARRYLKVTQPRYSPHKRARIRAFFSEGVDKFLLPWAVEALPTMLHLALFLFFAGLAVFLWNVNLTVFKLVLSWVGLCTALYGCITFIPVFCHDSPYHTPLSLPAWHFVTGIPCLIYQALERLTYLDYFSAETYVRFVRLADESRKSLVQGMQKTAEATALKSPSEIHTRSFMWTFDCLDEDHELERFYAGLPGFRTSKVVKDPLPDLTWEQQAKLLNAWIGLWDRTVSSDLLPELVKIRRTVICGKAIEPANILQTTHQILSRIGAEDQFGPVQSAEIARLVRGWDNGNDKETTMVIRATSSSVVARAQQRDDLWFANASIELDVPESVLRNHAMHGNDLSLTILNHLVRQQFSLFQEEHWPYYQFSKVLLAASKFDVLDTSLELQHEFCALWNQLVHADVVIPWSILTPIRNIYLTLHLHTDSAPAAFDASTGDEEGILYLRSSYPLCNIPGHHPDSTTHIPDDSASTPIPRSVLHDDVALATTYPPDPPSPSVPAPLLIDEHTTDVPLPDNYISVTASVHPAHPAAESLSNSGTLPVPPAAVDVTLDIDTFARSIPTATPETLTSTSSVPPTGELSLQDNAGLLAHSKAPEIPSPASREPVLDHILPTRTPPTLTLSCPNLTHRLTQNLITQ